MPDAFRVQHFLITRFNLRIRDYQRDKRGGVVLTPEWLQERLALFERYCFPSVLHQTERRFAWLLLIDEATDAGTMARLESCRARMDRLELVRMPEIDDPGALARPVLERLDPDTEVLVTTRLDNDDALHEDALCMIRQHVRPRREFLNLRLGYETDGRRAKVVSHKYGHFSTFVEPRSAQPFLTVYCGSHGKVRKIAPVRQLADRAAWLRVIHERNVANEGFEERERHYSFDSLRGVHGWLRHRVAGRVRRWFWPQHHRREYRLDEIAPAFHIGE
jgi:hypothetical protein